MDINEKLIEMVNEALDRLYINERYLFESNSSERNIVFHFARYFIEIIKENDIYKNYNVDCEYNRDLLDAKMSGILGDKKGKYRIYPDFIFHKRGTNENNMLAIEFKKNRPSSQEDKDKLMFLTNNQFRYNYRLGLFIKLTKQREYVEIVKYRNGKKEEK